MFIEQVLRKPAAATITEAAMGVGLDELNDAGALEAPKKLAGHAATSASDGSAQQTQVSVAGNQQKIFIKASRRVNNQQNLSFRSHQS